MYIQINQSKKEISMLNISVTKDNNQALKIAQSKVNKFIIELYWESKHDIDASLVALDNNRIDDDGDRILYCMNMDNVLQSDTSVNIKSGTKYPFQNKGGYLLHTGDVRDGLQVDGADETMIFDATKAPNNINSVAIVVGIYPPTSATFSEVKNAKVIVKDETGLKLLEGNLTTDFDQYDVVRFGSFVKDENGQWNFLPQGVGFNGGFNQVFASY